MLWHHEHLSMVIITTAKGMVPMLTTELEDLGFEVSGATETGVSVQTNMAGVMRLNLMLRTAHRIFWKLGDGTANHPSELHKKLTAWPWELWIPDQGYVCVTASGQTVSGDDPRFVALKVKDAIMDRMNAQCGHRPDSGPARDHTVVHLHWESRYFTAYLDTSGEPLSHRGYRIQPYKAPMRETLAAACVIGSGWTGDTPLVNPMCGSGTVAIEAAMIASKTPSGFLRTNFGFMHLVGFEAGFWKSVRDPAGRDRIVRPHTPRIYASDIDPNAIAAARSNVERAGLGSWIQFTTADFRNAPLPPPPGHIVFNPEYGERLGQDKELAEHYKSIGDYMKQKAQGYTGVVFTGNAEMIKPIGLKPRLKLQLFNGPIECRLLVFDLYDGTKRDRRLKREGNRKNSPD